MRILLITHFFPPRSNAGTENYTLGIARALVERGHDVLVLCAGDWETGAAYWNGVSAETVDGIPVRRAELNWKRAHDPNRILFASNTAREWVAGVLAEWQPDVVHVTSTYSLGVTLMQAVKDAGIPLVLTLMDFWFVCPRTTLLRADGAVCDGRTSAWECQQCLLADSGAYRRTRRVLPESVQRWGWQFVSRRPTLARRPGARGMALDMVARKAMMRQALQWPDRVISHSRFVQQMVAHAGVSDRVQQLRNGHELSWLDRTNGKTPSAAVRFGYMGQIHVQKGVYELVEAFLQAGFGERARLDIWGDLEQNRAYVRRLRALIDANSTVQLRGRFKRERLADVLADMDVIVVPSLWYENAPLVIDEAFAARTPVIATNLGGMAEAIEHNHTGLLFELGDSADLVRQMRRVVDEPGLLARLARNIGPVKTAAEEIVQLEAIYHDLLLESPKTAHE